MSDNTLKLGGQNFQQEILEHRGTALVDFGADWCAPCRALAPTVDAIAAATRTGAKIGKVDIDAEPELAEAHGVQSIPTLVFFRDGAEVDRIVGVATRGEIERRLAEVTRAA